MMSSDDFDQKFDKLLEKEKGTEPNPFIATRILSRIDREFNDQGSISTPVWLKVVQPVVVSMALAIGILIGANLSDNQADNNPSTASESNIQKIKSDLFISEIIRDDQVLPLNETQP